MRMDSNEGRALTARIQAEKTTDDLIREMRAEQKASAERQAARHPDCTMCATIAAEGGLGPSHEASERCESGKRAHCTCDTCW